ASLSVRFKEAGCSDNRWRLISLGLSASASLVCKAAQSRPAHRREIRNADQVRRITWHKPSYVPASEERRLPEPGRSDSNQRSTKHAQGRADSANKLRPA
ncbi:hypothetical protein H4R99_006558, partial [Coemansia sp. RSA 1722]